MAKPLRIQLIARDNGAGLSRDLDVLKDVLAQAGCEVSVRALAHRSRLGTRLRTMLGALTRRLRRPRFDINLMLERVRPEFFGQARHDVLVPNPEWFDEAWRRYLPRFSLVLAKTRHAERLFGELGCRVRYVGFVGPDHRQAGVARQPGFLHAPGRSGNKGSMALLELWAKHPHWPMLTLVWRRKRVALETLPANVTWHREYVPQATLQHWQNAIAFHLCPSRTEGYGHYLAEALGTGAVTITTDAEPMNELVTPARGVLVAAHAVGRQGLATLYDFDEPAMAAAIERCVAMPAAEAEAIGQAARAWFDANRTRFAVDLLEALIDIG
jgi:glycosyltransferase involved in cell wall biosynthesis